MKRAHFAKIVEEALDSIPQEFRKRIRNVAVRGHATEPAITAAARTSKAAASGSLPGRAYDQEEHIQPADRARLRSALSEEY